MAEADPNLTIDETVEAPELTEAEERVVRTVEDFARDRGWRPKDEYNGDPTDWRDAESFVAWGLDRSRDVSRDLKNLRATTEQIVRTTADLTAREVEKARADERAKWEQAHARAVDEGDGQGAQEALGKIVELAATPKDNSPQSDPTVQSFVAENAWFNTDPAAQAVAVATCDAAAKRGLPVAEQLKEAKEAVLKRFPEYAPEKPKAPAGVNAPASRANPSAGRAKGFSDLPANAQAVARSLHSRGLGTLEGYATQYFSGKGA